MPRNRTVRKRVMRKRVTRKRTACKRTARKKSSGGGIISYKNGRRQTQREIMREMANDRKKEQKERISKLESKINTNEMALNTLRDRLRDNPNPDKKESVKNRINNNKEEFVKYISTKRPFSTDKEKPNSRYLHSEIYKIQSREYYAEVNQYHEETDAIYVQACEYVNSAVQAERIKPKWYQREPTPLNLETDEDIAIFIKTLLDLVISIFSDKKEKTRLENLLNPSTPTPI